MLDKYREQLQSLIGEHSHIGILGYGVEGRSTHRLLVELCPQAQIHIYDKNQVNPIFDDAVLHCGEDYLAQLDSSSIVFRSPGVKVPSAYKGRVTSQSQIFTSLLRDKIVGVTGTKGKSTTTTLIHHILSSSYKVALAGNIGVPAFDCLDMEYDYVVFEYSCHQLSDMEVSPRHAVLLNLFPEHLDYYASVEEYYNAKRRIFLYQKEGEQSYSITGLGGQTEIGFDKEIQIDSCRIKADTDGISVDETKLSYAPNLLGEHNKVNQLFAVAIASNLGVTPDNIQRKLDDFNGLAHRLEVVHRDEGLLIINDSISTIPQSAIAAMEAFDGEKTALIGGYDRGIDYRPLATYLDENTEVNPILFSDVGKVVNGLLTQKRTVYPTFVKAVEASLQTETNLILLSPGASSYDEFKSFAHRGDRFKEIITQHLSDQS